MNGEKLARILAGVAVLAVAVIAAVVSFTHIESLALANGYTIDTARLLPFSVDGLIVASSLSLVTGGRTGLARLGLVLGVTATVAANVVFGVRFGVTGAVVNSWPAVAFIVSSEILVGMMRGTGPTAARDESAGTVADVAEVPQDVPAVPVHTPVTAPSLPQNGLASVPAGIPEGVPVDVPADVPTSTVRPVPVGRVRTVTSSRVPRRAPARPRRTPDPAKLFERELEAGELPSLRLIKQRAHVGTDKARTIRDELAQVMAEAQPDAA